jgi:RNA polymerase sigma-70 factor (ECF subfamily)
MLENKRSNFESLVKAYSAELYRYAYWLCRDRFVAEDLVQETFTRAWQAWERLRDDKAAKSWLYTILCNEHARLFERKRLDTDDAQELDQIADPTSDTVLEQLEMRDALKALPQGYSQPLLLQVLGGFSCADIAGIMGISEGAVMTRLTRARLALRKSPATKTQRTLRTR